MQRWLSQIEKGGVKYACCNVARQALFQKEDPQAMLDCELHGEEKRMFVPLVP
jgi:hypothetical protein